RAFALQMGVPVADGRYGLLRGVPVYRRVACGCCEPMRVSRREPATDQAREPAMRSRQRYDRKSGLSKKTRVPNFVPLRFASLLKRSSLSGDCAAAQYLCYVINLYSRLDPPQA